MSTFDEFYQSYRDRSFRFKIVSLGLGIILFVIFIASIAISQYNMSFTEAFSLLWDHINGAVYSREEDYDLWFKDHVVWNQNLPRFLSGLLIGTTLSVGGAMMQSTIKNPLADPYTTGIASGALFGVSLFIILGITLPLGLGKDLGMVAMAFVFSLIPSGLIIVATLIKKRTMSPTAMILVGIGAMYIFTSASALLRFSADQHIAQEVFEWTLGSVGKVGWEGLPIVLASSIVILLFSAIYSRKIDVLSEGDSVSTALGVNPRTMRILSLVVVSLCTALVVCFAGTIGFVGLICPHIGRALVSTSNRYLIPASALIGAAMLTATDCLARVTTPTGLPVGVITALIGSPIFVYILIKQRKESW